MVADADTGKISPLVVDDAFANQDDDFVNHLRGMTAPRYLAGLADRWKKDPRPWARQQILLYLAQPLDRPGHHPLVKRLFKQAEANRDSELMAAFMVAFDRLVRQQRRARHHYDFQTRQYFKTEELYFPRDQILPTAPQSAGRNSYPARAPKNGKLFSYKTRNYLRRRASRYFRYMGFQRPTEYVSSVSRALALYRDADMAAGENILDNWSLLQIAFRRSPVLQFGRSSVKVADSQSLEFLVAAPRFEKLWMQPDATEVLIKLLVEAKSRLVRVWATQLLKRHHLAALKTISADRLLTLLDHFDDEVQQFGASLLHDHSGIDTWPIGTWLRLLETKNLSALAAITDAMNQRVRPDRLSAEQCVELACSRPTPVARLGLSWFMNRSSASTVERASLVRLAGVKCDVIGQEAAKFALSILGSTTAYGRDEVCQFFDSLNAEVRRGAWEWLTATSPGYHDAALWCRLLETPYEDVRLRLIDVLQLRTAGAQSLTELRKQDLSSIWATVLLGVHRGGRAKLKALRQISEAIAQHPQRAEQLIPVLAVAIRSVRPAEARAGLSALLTAVAVQPQLETLLAGFLPELKLSLAEVAS